MSNDGERKLEEVKQVAFHVSQFHGITRIIKNDNRYCREMTNVQSRYMTNVD